MVKLWTDEDDATHEYKEYENWRIMTNINDDWNKTI
jgi:hypothetical protein